MKALSIVARMLAGAGIGMLVAGIAKGNAGIWLPGVAFLCVGLVAYMYGVLRKRG